MMSKSHIVNGKFQSDKYPSCPAGKVPLSTKDPMAQDLLWEYAVRRMNLDRDFSLELKACLKADGYQESTGQIKQLKERIEELETTLHHIAEKIIGMEDLLAASELQKKHPGVNFDKF